MKRIFAIALFSYLTICQAAQARIFNLQETVLSNGMTVVTVEDKSAPVITLQMFLDASVRKEKKGITGISHFSEHFFFMGSKKVKPGKITDIIKSWGGFDNAYTGLDFTSYFANVPKERLDNLVELYADTIGSKIFPQEKFNSEINVVREERRLTDNSPHRSAFLGFQDLAFPGSNYSFPILGYWDDLKGMKVEDVKTYYRDYYSVSNIVAVVAGDITHSEVLRSFNKWFGPIKGRKIKPYESKTLQSQNKERRKLKEREGQKLPMIFIGYEGIEFDDPDYMALMALSSILSEGASSRFSKVLIKDKKVAKTTYSHILHTKERGLFTIYAQPVKGVSSSIMERAVYGELARVKDEGVSEDELKKIVTGMEKAFITGLQSTRDKADTVGRAYMLSKDKNDYNEKYLDRLRAVNIDDVKKVARKYLKPEKRNVYIQLPKGESYYGTTLKDVDIKEHKDIKEITYKSGLKLFFQHSDEIPAVSLRVELDGGSAFDPKGKEGLANLTVAFLNKGTKEKDEKNIAEILDKNAIDFSSWAVTERIGIDMGFLKGKTDLALEMLSDMMLNMSVKEKILARERKRTLSSIESGKSNPHNVASRAFYKAVFGKSRTGHHSIGYLRSVKRIKTGDMMKLYRKFFRTGNTRIFVVGDLDLEYLVDLIGDKFSNYPKGRNPVSYSGSFRKPPGATYYVVDLPWLTQSYISIGGNGILRSDPNYNDARLMNYILGGAGLSSRLGSILRTKEGLAYSVRSKFVHYKKAGVFKFNIQTKTESTKAAIDGFFREINRYSLKGADKKELDDAKSYYSGVLPFRTETIGQKASIASSGVFYGLGPNMVYNDVDEIKKASLKGINSQAKRFLSGDFVVLIAGNKEKIKKELKGTVKIQEIALKSLY